MEINDRLDNSAHIDNIVINIFSVDETKQLIILIQSLNFKMYWFIRYHTARNYPTRGIPPLSPTQMQCDVVIEKKLKGQDIHLPSDYIRITKAARKTPSQLGATLLNLNFKVC